MITHKMKSAMWYGGPCWLLVVAFLAAGVARAQAGARGNLPPEFLKPCEMKRFGDECKVVRAKVEKSGSCIAAREDARKLFCALGSHVRPAPAPLLGACLKKRENDPCAAQLKRRKVQGHCKTRPGNGLVCLAPGVMGGPQGPGGPPAPAGELKDAKKGQPLGHPLNPAHTVSPGAK